MKPTTIDEYIHQFDGEAKARLEEIRMIVREVVPGAKEKISYGMPALATKKVLVYYAAWKEHIGFYPTASGIAAFAEQFAKYTTSKGAVQFPYSKPLPKRLIQAVVKFRFEETGS